MKFVVLFACYCLTAVLFYQQGSFFFHIVENEVFKLLNSVFFSYLLTLLVYLLVSKGKALFRDDRRFVFSLASVLAVSAVYIFIVLANQVNGRFGLLPLVVSSSFENYESFFYYFNSIDSRSYEKVLMDLFVAISGASLTPDRILFIHKVVGVMTLTSAFYAGKAFFKNSVLGVLVALTFALSHFVQYNLTSIEYGSFSLLFAVLTVNFLLRHIDNGDADFLKLAILTCFLTGFFRFEFTVILGTPVLLLICIFSNRGLLSFRAVALIALLMSIRLVPTLVLLSSGSDAFIYGQQIQAESIFSFLSNIQNVLKNNLVVNQDLNVTRGNISYLTYLSFLSVVAVAITIISKILNRKNISTYEKKALCSAVLYVFMFCLIIMTHFEGLRSGEKFSVHFFILEILLGYGLIYSVFLYYLKNRFERRLPQLTFVMGIALLFAMARMDNRFFSLNHFPQSHPEMELFKDLKTKNLGSQCTLVKYNTNTPIIDHLFPMQMKSREFETVDKLKEWIGPERCFYFFESQFESPKPDVLNSEKVAPVFDKCQKDIIYFKENYYQLLKISC